MTTLSLTPLAASDQRARLARDDRRGASFEADMEDLHNLEPGSLTLSRTFQELGRRASREEWARLEAFIAKRGAERPVVAWKETGIVLDGYKVLMLCVRHGRQWQVTELSFPDRRSAIEWRRANVKETDYAYFEGIR